jgi:hypothetical protein
LITQVVLAETPVTTAYIAEIVAALGTLKRVILSAVVGLSIVTALVMSGSTLVPPTVIVVAVRLVIIPVSIVDVVDLKVGEARLIIVAPVVTVRFPMVCSPALQIATVAKVVTVSVPTVARLITAAVETRSVPIVTRA